jgi:NAD(P)-dependent dehydrogenase (short-subunit alcohol dehydrogenase family)
MMLQGKVALITGAANGIGLGIAHKFAREGAAVGIMDIDAAGCERAAEEVRAAGGQALALPGDVTRRADVHNALHRLVQAFGKVNVVVHNAAVMPSASIDETTEEQWEKTFAVVCKGAYLCSHEAIPLLRQAGGGSIIFMSSITGVVGLPGLAAYSAAKGALISLARAMAIDHACDNIRVNAISPGTIDSPMLHRFIEEQADPEATRKAFNEMYPRGYVGTIEEVANVFAFVASDLASFVSGANYMVDGGMSVKSEQPRL